MAGIVYLIGAGPGDTGLLTIKGAECIKKADVIVYDYLADNKLLTLADKHAQFIYVGKKASQHTMQQEEINQLLVNKAREGKIVARLKGGDPFVFGRGGEEALALKNNSLPFEIIPGVTSAIAAAAYAGIPVTHRKIASSFAVVTGHEDPTRKESGLNWSHLATGVDTLVFLMGVGKLPYITEQLMKNGRAANTPAALIRWGTKPQQEVLLTTVENAAQDTKLHGLKPPAIFVVGNVVKLRDSLKWFDNKILFGKNILITRSREQASKLTNQLEQLGANCLEAPTIKITDPDDNYAGLDKSIDNIHTYDWLIFTSVNGVEKFFDRLHCKHHDTRILNHVKIAAIGGNTAEKLLTYGIKADCVPEEFRAESLLTKLQPYINKNSHILLARAKEARAILPEKLHQAGAAVDVIQCYRTVTADFDYSAIIDKFKAGKIDLITFTSSSTVLNLLKLINGKTELLNDVLTACIGPITAATCRAHGLKSNIIAQTYTIDGLTNAIKNFYQPDN